MKGSHTVDYLYGHYTRILLLCFRRDSPALPANIQRLLDKMNRLETLVICTPGQLHHEISLPPNWERWQDHLGRNYYVDHGNRATAWDRSTFNQTTNTNEHVSERNMARDGHNQRIIVDEMLEDNSANTTEAEVARQDSSAAPTPIVTTPAPTADGAGPLPAGWEERQTPEGRVYYVDRKFRILAVWRSQIAIFL
jgi:hypothetical protein